MRKQPAALEDITDAAAQLNRIDAQHVGAFDRDGANVSLDQPVGEPQQRGLAGAGAADDGEEFALGDLKRDVVDRDHAPRATAAVETLADMGIGDQGWGWHSVATSYSHPALEGEGRRE